MTFEEQQHCPDYIFIDINMPRMNGYACAREVGSHYMTGEIQIVMYSTAFNPADKARCEEQGFKYIIKQNSLSQLVQSIKGVMSKGVISYHLI